MSHFRSSDQSSNRSKSLLEEKETATSSDRSSSSRKKQKKTFTKSVPVLGIQSVQNVEEVDEWISYTKYTNKEYQKRQWRCLRFYTVCNAVRWIIVATLIFYSNWEKQERIEKYQSHCCRCWFISQYPSGWDHITDNQRVDLSYCVPKCTTCKSCKQSLQGMSSNNYFP